MPNDTQLSKHLHRLAAVLALAMGVTACCGPKQLGFKPLPEDQTQKFVLDTPEINSQEAAQAVLYAMMSYNAYHEKNGFVFPLKELGWQLVDGQGKPIDQPTYENPANGLAYDIYEKIGGNEVVFAYRGTDNWLDWVANASFSPRFDPFKLADKYPHQYQQARELFEQYAASHPDKKIVAVTGHSLGGGIALDISFRNGVNAVTFDASPNTDNPFCLCPKPAQRMLVYQENEALQYLREFTPCMYLEVPVENRRRTRFDFGGGFENQIDPVHLHQSGPLAMGLLQLAAKSDAAQAEFCDKLHCSRNPSTVAPKPETALTSLLNKQGWDKDDANALDKDATGMNAYDQIALSALFASHAKNKQPLTAYLSDKPAACVPGNDAQNPPPAWNELLGELQQQGALKEAGKKGVDKALPLDEKQRQQAWELLVTGRGGQDQRQSLFDMADSLKKINPNNLQKTVQAKLDTDKVLSVFNALADDFKSFDKADGSKQKVLSNTLNTLQSEPLGEVVSDLAKVFISLDNKTMRLAIIAYARMNGINLTEENLDDLNQVFDRDNTGLYPLLAGALDSMKQEYGVNDAKQGVAQAKEAIAKIKQRENAACGDVKSASIQDS